MRERDDVVHAVSGEFLPVCAMRSERIAMLISFLRTHTPTFPYKYDKNVCTALACTTGADDRATVPVHRRQLHDIGGPDMRAQQCVCPLGPRSMVAEDLVLGASGRESVPLGAGERGGNDSARYGGAITYFALLARASWNSYDQR